MDGLFQGKSLEMDDFHRLPLFWKPPAVHESPITIYNLQYIGQYHPLSSPIINRETQVALVFFGSLHASGLRPSDATAVALRRCAWPRALAMPGLRPGTNRAAWRLWCFFFAGFLTVPPKIGIIDDYCYFLIVKQLKAFIFWQEKHMKHKSIWIFGDIWDDTST